MRMIEWHTGVDHFIDREDSRRVAQAYSGLLYVSQRDVPSAQVLSVDFTRFIYKFVLSTLGPTNIATPQDLISVSFTSVEFLWLLVEHRPRISVPDQDKLRLFMLYIQTFTTKIEEQRIVTGEDRRAFGLALGDADFQNLVGRILLIATLEGYLGSILQVIKVIAYSSVFTPERIPDAKADWVKGGGGATAGGGYASSLGHNSHRSGPL
ncbi:hypothetical protein FRC08_004844 [Ceratobasidium sp. 394]|nr:hypothetical protein FRC08_004844 [Ceratobasidium sp. 394]